MSKRTTLILDDKLFEDLNAHVPYGFKRYLLEKLIRLAVDAIKTDGQIMIGALIAGEYKLVRDDPNRETA